MNPWKKNKNVLTSENEMPGRYIKKQFTNLHENHIGNNDLENKYIKYKFINKLNFARFNNYEPGNIRNKISNVNELDNNDVYKDIDRRPDLEKYLIKEPKISFKAYFMDYIIRRKKNTEQSDLNKLFNKKSQCVNQSNINNDYMVKYTEQSHDKFTDNYAIPNKNYQQHEMHSINLGKDKNTQIYHSSTLDTNIERKPLVPANPFLNAKIPEWIIIYSVAPKELDCNLKWDIFNLEQLESFEAILKRLYMQELEKIVMKYESYRMILSKKIELCIYNNNKYRPNKNETIMNKDDNIITSYNFLNNFQHINIPQQHIINNEYIPKFHMNHHTNGHSKLFINNYAYYDYTTTTNNEKYF
ncbi:unnamed protein product [Gordionus sp. m RMFG-2023]